MDNESLRIKYLFEYQLKEKNKRFPSFEEYKQQYLQQNIVDEEEKPTQPVSEPAPDGGSTIPEPTDEPTPAPVASEPQQAPSVAVEPSAETPAPEASQAEPEVAPEPVSDEIYKKLEDEMSSQRASIDKILKILEPEPEPSPEEKIIAKIDSLSKEVQDLKNADAVKKEKVKNASPFNISLSKMWNDAEDKEEEELTISQADIDNYDPAYIKKTLGIPDSIREGYVPPDMNYLKSLHGSMIKAVGKSGMGEGVPVVGIYNFPSPEYNYHSLLRVDKKSKMNGMRYEINVHSIEPLN